MLGKAAARRAYHYANITYDAKVRKCIVGTFLYHIPDNASLATGSYSSFIIDLCTYAIGEDFKVLYAYYMSLNKNNIRL